MSAPEPRTPSIPDTHQSDTHTHTHAHRDDLTSDNGSARPASGTGGIDMSQSEPRRETTPTPQRPTLQRRSSRVQPPTIIILEDSPPASSEATTEVLSPPGGRRMSGSVTVGGEPEAGFQELADRSGVEEREGEEELGTYDSANDLTLRDLREISSLASWTVSTHKPGCGSAALLTPSPLSFWQSDGPQPHLLTIHFTKMVKIVRLRVYLDFALDESYTPTRMEFFGGCHGPSYGLVKFATWTGTEPRGWQEISLVGQGVRGDDELRAFVIQIRVMENHQSGKDTHVRGVQIFARDEKAPSAVKAAAREARGETEGEATGGHPGEKMTEEELSALLDGDWSEEELR